MIITNKLRRNVIMKKIMIDVGHGGADPGACANGLVEKDINLKVSKMIKAKLQAGYDVEVRMTRETDISLEPDNRVKIVNDFNPDLCISVHHNSASGQARGAEVIHAAKDPQDDKLADEILKLLAAAGMPARRSFFKTDSQGRDWYYMIRRIINNDTDAIITEGGFVDNIDDAKLLSDDNWLEKEAAAITTAAVHYLGLTEKQNPQITQPMHWGTPFIQELKARGLISGDHGGDDPLTWAEFAKVIVGILKQFDKR